ncbi:uncharacterized protein LOC130509068 isoform X2 [Raphanus sativus]|uniref:Uncharacterized protein LOC130509068 isoform X2 n=1 Tax=Raphanus sativus TaxID=3726 RepID=A0A9W3DA33_RAPSA|nr:uncharacterized protein LOC130509068 isoform X2 [Raphanus sativus]
MCSVRVNMRELTTCTLLARVPRYAVLDGSPPLQLRRSFRLPLKQLCSSSMALMVNAAPLVYRPPADTLPYEYPPVEVLSPVAPPPLPPDPPDALLSLLRIRVTSTKPSLQALTHTLDLKLHCSTMATKICGGGVPLVCRSFPCRLVEWSVLRSCPDLPSHPPVTAFQLEGKLVDISCLLNLILTGIGLPIVSCLELFLFPIFPLVWSEMEDKALLVLKGSSSQLMLPSAVDAVFVTVWVTLGTIIKEAYEIVVMRFLWFLFVICINFIFCVISLSLWLAPCSLVVSSSNGV